MVRLEKACCCFSLRFGTTVLGCLTLVGCIVSVATLGPALHSITKDDPERNLKIGIWAFEITLNCLQGTAAILLLHGVRKEKEILLVPYLVSSILQIIGSVCVCIVVLMSQEKQLVASASITLILNVYFYIIVWSHYKDLEESGHGVNTYA